MEKRHFYQKGILILFIILSLISTSHYLFASSEETKKMIDGLNEAVESGKTKTDPFSVRKTVELSFALRNQLVRELNQENKPKEALDYIDGLFNTIEEMAKLSKKDYAYYRIKASFYKEMATSYGLLNDKERQDKALKKYNELTNKADEVEGTYKSNKAKRRDELLN